MRIRRLIDMIVVAAVIAAARSGAWGAVPEGTAEAAATVIAESKSPEMVQSFVQRVEPDGSMGLGYFTYFAGYTGPMFKAGGPTDPPESLAHFTFRFDRVGYPVAVLMHGTQLTVQQRATWTIWYDPTPDGDFGNPDSFTDDGPGGDAVKIGEVSAKLVQFTIDLRTGYTYAASFSDEQTFAGSFTGPDGVRYTFGAAGDKTRWDSVATPDPTDPPDAAHQFAVANVVEVERRAKK